MDRLQRLIFSFYREDPRIESLLKPLQECHMSRSWGSIRLECKDIEHLEKVCGLISYIRIPLASLGLGRQIVLRVPGSVQRTYSMNVPFHTDLIV